MARQSLYNRIRRFSGALRAGKAWEAASKTMRRIRNWTVSQGSPDGETIQDLPTLRQRSRDLVRNEPFGRGAVNVLTQAVIGRGLKPQSIPDIPTIAKHLGKDTEDPEILKTVETFSGQAERNFKLWAESQQSDARGQLTYYDLQSNTFKNYLQSGDVFFTTNIRKHRHSPFRIRIGLIEADQVGNPLGIPEGVRVRGGVEVDPFGEPTAYWVNKNQEVFPMEYARVPRFGPASKRQMIWHLFKPERIGNSRGVPFLAPVMVTIKNKNRYSKAELDAAVNNSILAMIVKSSNPNALTSGLESDQSDESKSQTGIDFTIGPGAQVIQLQDDEDVIPFNPQRPYSGYNDFIISLSKEIGMALNIPYEILLRQFNSSYTASRAAYNMFERTRDVERSWFNLNFNRPVYHEVITEEILSGRLEAPGFLEGDYFIRQAWLKHAWTGDSIGQINPIVETQAAANRVKSHFSTTTAETAGLTGGDYSENIQTLAREDATRKRAGVSPPDTVATNVKTQAEAVKAAGEGKKAVDEGNRAESETEDLETGVIPGEEPTDPAIAD